MTYNKPTPALDPDSTKFWESCRAHQLQVQQCSNCNRKRFPAKAHCANCQSTDHDWVEASNTGHVYSWIVVRHPIPKSVFGDDVPYAVALIDLEPGVRMVSRIVDCDPDDVAANMQVQVKFDDVTDELTLPNFKPIDR